MLGSFVPRLPREPRDGVKRKWMYIQITQA